jgi:hypothetical protein
MNTARPPSHGPALREALHGALESRLFPLCSYSRKRVKRSSSSSQLAWRAPAGSDVYEWGVEGHHELVGRPKLERKCKGR